ncbi:MAG: class I SAM-dependent methyltransferase [Rhizobacter sp.]|nr:class I SAM-dependent methyltransferase [Rhizobacter sp.]
MSRAAPAHQHWSALRQAASQPYRQAGPFAWRFAHGKLGFDPVFQHLLSQGLIAPRARVLDIGCGQGLLASLLRACTLLAQQGQWPSQWAAAPAAVRVTGIDLRPRDIERAKASLGDAAEFVCGDMRLIPFPEADTVVLLDVLHYINVAEQNEVLVRVRRALPPHGTLLLRVGDATARLGFRFSQWVDTVVAWARTRRVVPLAGRPLAEWVAQLESLGFDVCSQPMSRGTLFSNVLLVAKVRSA